MTDTEAPGAREIARSTVRLLWPFVPVFLLGTALGLVAGAATAWLLALINRAAHASTVAEPSLLLAIAALCCLSVAGTAASGSVNSALGQRLVHALRTDVAARLLRSPIRALELRRPHEIMAVLTGDIDTVSVFTFNFSGYAIALATALGGFAYLAWLSFPIFAVTLLSVAVGLIVTLVAKAGWIRDYIAVRRAQDDLHRDYRSLVEGAKELKINRPRRLRLFASLGQASDGIRHFKSHAMRGFWVADAASSAAFLGAILVILAASRWMTVDGSAVSGAVITLLYVRAPIAQLATAIPAFEQARIALRRIAAVAAEFDRADDARLVEVGEPRSPAFRSLQFRNVTFGFPPSRPDAAPFTLGPIDLVVEPGEILFIVGENGSGKTTLVKLLLGIYAPQHGEIRLNDMAITDETRDDYRQHFSAVLSDYHLFADIGGSAATADGTAYIARLGLAGKVAIVDGRFSTTDLSSGQRKRLALANAYLEARPLIVFDEWAADQDPSFRRRFYTEILPELRAAGRTVIAVSHDDRYLDCADRVVHMHDGRITAGVGAGEP